MNELKLIGGLLQLPPVLPPPKEEEDSIGFWKAVGPDIVPGSKFCPEAVTSYAKDPKSTDPTIVRMHLSYLGWKLEFNRDGGIRFRYTSPQDPELRYLSLRKVCQYLREEMGGCDQEGRVMPKEEEGVEGLVGCGSDDDGVERNIPEVDQWFRFDDDAGVKEEVVDVSEAKQVIKGGHVSSVVECFSSDVGVGEEEVIPEAKQVIKGGHVTSICQYSNNDMVVAKEQIINGAKRAFDGKETREVVVVEEECCPQAVLDWYLYEPKRRCREGGVDVGEMILKAKKHLSYMGWVLWKGNKGNRKELRYTSPTGVCYYSLRMACKACIEEGGVPSVGDLNGDLWLQKRKREEDLFLQNEQVGVNGKT